MRSRYSALLPVLFALVLPNARAAILDIQLVSSTITGSAGQTITFSGKVANSSGMDIFVNGAGITLADFGPADSDLTNFILNATGLLPAGSSIRPTGLFTVAIPNSFATGRYDGTLTVQGGIGANDDANLGSAPFEVVVNAAPEPGSSMLVMLALGVIALRVRRRQRLIPIRV